MVPKLRKDIQTQQSTPGNRMEDGDGEELSDIRYMEILNDKFYLWYLLYLYVS